MKSVLTAVAMIALTVPAFADAADEGRVLLEAGASNPVTNTAQLAAGLGVDGADAATLVALMAAQADDDMRAVRALSAAPEVISTQGVLGGSDANQIAADLQADGQEMSLNARVAAYFEEISD
ncbi:MAG: hypothetical protein AAGA70_10785 [Pseudomonadota bacterium]